MPGGRRPSRRSCRSRNGALRHDDRLLAGDHERAARRGELVALRQPELVGLPSGSAGRSRTVSSIGQLPASSFGKSASDARAFDVPAGRRHRPITRTGPARRRRSPTRKPTPNAASASAAASAGPRAAPRRRGKSGKTFVLPFRAPREPGESSGGGPAATSSSCTRSSRSRSRRLQSLADELVEVGRARAHANSSSSASARRASALRVRVFTVPSGRLQILGDLALREAAPVGELDHGALVLRAAPRARGGRATRSIRVFDAVGRPWLAGGLLGGFGGGLGRAPAGRPRSRSARPRRATARRYHAHGRSCDAERQIAANASWTASSARPRSPRRRSARPKTGARVAAVELVEGLAVARADQLDQLAVGQRRRPPRRDRARGSRVPPARRVRALASIA